jgi:hypothetical protein
MSVVVLGLEDVRALVQRPVKSCLIQRAKLQQLRVRFHTETNITDADISIPASNFLSFVKELLPLDKYKIFKQLFQFPLKTTTIVDEIYRELSRVFYAKNASFTYQFTASEVQQDWLNYKQKTLHEPDIWKTTGWQKLKSSPNSFLVVDLPKIQTTDSPEPYFFWLDLEHVIDYQLEEDGKTIDYIIFKQPNNIIEVIDGNSYSLYQVDPKNYNDVTSLIVSTPHELGYCPVIFFWQNAINTKIPDIKANPIFKELSDLDWYLFFTLSKRHLDLYAAYPIYTAYEQECDYENEETGDYCDHGFLRNKDNFFRTNRDGTLIECPACAKRRITGAGSFLEVPVPDPSNGIADLKNAISITTIDKDSLDYNVSELERFKNEIIASTVGNGGNSNDASRKEALNETQIAANYACKTDVLIDLKTNFEYAQKFVDDTVCKLRYGEDFISSAISWGTEFYIFTLQELYDKFKSAKSNGASNAELESISQQILETEYHDNPLVLQRMYTLRQLEPFPNYTVDEVLTMYKTSLIDIKDVVLKINFIIFVDRFERENINILEFGKNLSFSNKITIIQNKLNDYVNERINNAGTVTGAENPVIQPTNTEGQPPQS